MATTFFLPLFSYWIFFSFSRRLSLWHPHTCTLTHSFFSEPWETLEVKGSGFSGSEVYGISPCSGVLNQNQLHIRISCIHHLAPRISWYPTGILGCFDEPNSIMARLEVDIPARNRYGSINLPENTRKHQTYVEPGFRAGEYEYSFSFGLAPRNGGL